MVGWGVRAMGAAWMKVPPAEEVGGCAMAEWVLLVMGAVAGRLRGPLGPLGGGGGPEPRSSPLFT